MGSTMESIHPENCLVVYRAFGSWLLVMLLRNLDQVNQKIMIRFNKRDSDEPIPHIKR